MLTLSRTREWFLVGPSLCDDSSCGVIDSIPASAPVKGGDGFAYFLLQGPQSSLNSC